MMPDSANKAAMIRRIADNPWLQPPTVSLSAQSDVDLSVDQPHGALSPDIAEFAAAALERGMTHYADVPGVWELREELVGFLASVGLPDTSATNLLVTAGVQESRFLTIQMVGADFDAIGVPLVVHPGVRQALGVRSLATVEISVTTDDTRYLPSLDGLRTALSEGCRLLYLESPSRLTGAAYSRQEVEALAALIRNYDASVIWDQGLAPWVQPDAYASLAAQPDVAAKVVTLGEAWPGMGLESWLVGYIVANAGWLEQMRSQKQIMSICTSVATQYAAIQAASLYDEAHSGHLEVIGEHHHAIAHALAKMGNRLLPGDAANVVAFAPGAGMTDQLRRAGIEVANGISFGAPEIMRLAIPFATNVRDAITGLAR